jgi:hypothetical protein
MSNACSFVTYRSAHGTSRPTADRATRTGSAFLTRPFSRITLLERVATDPLNGTYPCKHSWQQLSHRQVFDLPISNGGPDYRFPSESIATPGPGPGPGAGPASWALANLANIADTAITPIFMRLRCDLRVPVGIFSGAVMFVRGVRFKKAIILSDGVKQLTNGPTVSVTIY